MKRTSKQIRKAFLFSLVILVLTGFVLRPWGVRFDYEPSATAQIIRGPALEGTVFAVTASNKLISFNQFTPSALILQPTQITGLQTGENVVGIDFRPRTGVLYAVTNQSRVYTINTMTAAATVVGAAPFTPAVTGASFGVDFNPVPDLIRFVSDADQNLRINPNDGTVAGTDTNLVFAATDANAAANPTVVGSAYTNNFLGATSTTLYGIDSALGILVTQGSVGGTPTSPNTGQLFTVGSLGVTTTNQVGFDIVGPTGLALASLTPTAATTSNLYTINLATGAATQIGTMPIGGGEIITDISAVVRVETIFALTTTNGLLSFSAGTPAAAPAATPITGLATGETLLGMDFRPANGLLYAVSNQSNVYIINTATAVATPVSATPFTPAAMGMNFGVDFNPVPDRIRFVSDAAQDLRLNPNNGTVAAMDTNLAFAPADANAAATPRVVGEAYTNNFAGAAQTTLYGIDSNLDILVMQGGPNGTPSPNGGQLTTIGSLTPMGGAAVDTGDEVGFDIAPTTNAAFASLTLGGVSTLTRINLANGASTSIGAIGAGLMIRDIAIAPIIEIIYATTRSNKLISFVATAPGTILSTAQITGLKDETIIGLDFRPATGQLFAIGSSSSIYTLDPLTGIATQVGPSPTNPQLNGSAYGFDFNPVPDRIRITSIATHNLRFVPGTGLSAIPPTGTDTALAYATADANAGMKPSITASAYDNNVAGTPSTTLYGIDSNLNILVRQGAPGGVGISPNTGQLFTVGPLGVDAGDNNGFDIADITNNAYAALNVGGTVSLYTVNLATGAVSPVGTIGGGEEIFGISVQNRVTPSMAAPAMAAVNAASFLGGAVASDSILALFGKFQTASGKLTLAKLPLGPSLDGVSVTVGGQPAQMLMTFNGQINIVAPSGVALGSQMVMVTNSDGTSVGGRVNVASGDPGIFTLNSSGSGTMSALWTNDGVLNPVFNPNLSAAPIPAGTAAKPTYLVLFLTGVRNAPAGSANITMNGINSTVTYCGPQGGFAGLDQCNAIVPAQLAGAGTVTVRVTAGRTSNAGTFAVQ
jgi:trimeric autotransporter adhesin